MEQLENEKQENENETIRRRLPPELLAEMHKCLPLAAAIHVLVNVPSRAIYQNNSPRMRRTVQRLKTWLNQYIDTMVFDGRDINREKLVIYNEIQWKPQLDLLLRYGAWLTSTRLVYFFYSIVGMPENFVEDLLLHMANSSSTQMMLHYVQMNFLMAPIPIPTSFFEQLLNNKEQYRRIGDRFLFESIHLETGDGRILHIYDGELSEYYNLNSTLRLVLFNKMDRTNWFEIAIFLDHSKKFIWKLEFSRFSMQSLEEFNDPLIEQNGNTKLEAKRNIFWSHNFELFLRRGAAFTQFRHFKIKEEYALLHADYYADFLICSVSKSKHPEEFLESIEINFDKNYSNSKLIEKLWKVCYEGIPDDGKFMNFDNEKLHILSAKSKPEKKWYESQFTMANLPTNGQYVFDIDIQLDVGVQSAGVEGLDQIVGIKIQKRKAKQAEDEAARKARKRAHEAARMARKRAEMSKEQKEKAKERDKLAKRKRRAAMTEKEKAAHNAKRVAKHWATKKAAAKQKEGDEADEAQENEDEETNVKVEVDDMDEV